MTELADYPQPEYQISLPSVSSFGQETHLTTNGHGGGHQVGQDDRILNQAYDTQV